MSPADAKKLIRYGLILVSGSIVSIRIIGMDKVITGIAVQRR